MASVFGLYPWSCHECRHHFYSRIRGVKRRKSDGNREIYTDDSGVSSKSTSSVPR
jgi:hypothetical protein